MTQSKHRTKFSKTYFANKIQFTINLEKHFMQTWLDKTGTPPDNWTVKDQRRYIKGLQHALDIVKNHNDYDTIAS